MRTFIISLLLFFSQAVYSQSYYLSIVKKNSHKERKIYDRMRVKATFEDGCMLKGRMFILGKDLLVIKGDTCAVSDIVKIQQRSLGRYAGYVLLPIGSAFIIGGAVSIVQGTVFGDEYQEPIVQVAFGVYLIWIGALPAVFGYELIRDMKKFNRDLWDIKVVEKTSKRSRRKSRMTTADDGQLLHSLSPEAK